MAHVETRFGEDFLPHDPRPEICSCSAIVPRATGTLHGLRMVSRKAMA
jgi:hypothetical protein